MLVMMPNCLAINDVIYHEDGTVKSATVINGGWYYESDGITGSACDYDGYVVGYWDLKEYWTRHGEEKVLECFGTNYNHAIESAIKIYDKE